MSLCLAFNYNAHKSNPCKIPITTAVINIDWCSLNFDQLFFVLLIVRTICTSKLKNLIMTVMGFKKKGKKSIYFPVTLIKNHSFQICLLGQFYRILLMTLSGDEFFYWNSGAPHKTKNSSSHHLIAHKWLPYMS